MQNARIKWINIYKLLFKKGGINNGVCVFYHPKKHQVVRTFRFGRYFKRWKGYVSKATTKEKITKNKK